MVTVVYVVGCLKIIFNQIVEHRIHKHDLTQRPVYSQRDSKAASVHTTHRSRCPGPRPAEQAIDMTTLSLLGLHSDDWNTSTRLMHGYMNALKYAINTERHMPINMLLVCLYCDGTSSANNDVTSCVLPAHKIQETLLNVGLHVSD